MNARIAVPLVAALSIAVPRTDATVEMQSQAKKLGFPVANCLYCHATPHAVDAMKKKARNLAMSDGNCLACHGKDIPAKLNARGDWLATERVKRGAKEADMAWLRDYREPAAPPAAKTPAKP